MVTTKDIESGIAKQKTEAVTREKQRVAKLQDKQSLLKQPVKAPEKKPVLADQGQQSSAFSNESTASAEQLSPSAQSESVQSETIVAQPENQTYLDGLVERLKAALPNGEGLAPDALQGTPTQFVTSVGAVGTTSKAIVEGLAKSDGVVFKAGEIAKQSGVFTATQRAQKLFNQVLKGALSKKALLFYGAWAGSVGMGKWGQGEAVESFTIPRSKFFIPEAIKTGNWTIVDESNEAADEFLNPSLLTDLGLWSPISAVLGATLKTKAIVQQQKLMTKFTDDQKIKQATEQDDRSYWEQRRKEEADQEKANVDYYNTERKKLLEWERQASIEARNEDAVFWANQRQKKRREEEEDRKALADFWQEYRKLSQKIADNQRPSKLSFGLI